MRAASGKINIANAIQHPQVIPFLGGQERAERYLPAHAQAYNTKIIGVWHTDDLNADSPLVRLLNLGFNDYDGLYGDFNMDYNGQLVGVRNASAEGAAQKITAPTKTKTIATPTLEQMLKVSQRFVADASRKEFEVEVRKLYKQ